MDSCLPASSGNGIATWWNFTKTPFYGCWLLLPVFRCAPRAVHIASSFSQNVSQQYGNLHNTFHYRLTCLGHVFGIFFILPHAVRLHKKGHRSIRAWARQCIWWTFSLFSSWSKIYFFSTAPYLSCRCDASTLSKKFNETYLPLSIIAFKNVVKCIDPW